MTLVRPDWFPVAGVDAADVAPTAAAIAAVTDELGLGFPDELMPVTGLGTALLNAERADARTMLRRARRHRAVFLRSRLELHAARRLEALGLGAVENVNGGPCRRFLLAEATG